MMIDMFVRPGLVKVGFMLEKIAASKMLNIIVMLTLLITAAREVYDGVEDIGVHHGVIFFAFYQILQSISAFTTAATKAKSL